MATNKEFKPLAAEFVSLLGKLIDVRIKQYFQKHHNSSESSFVNHFFVLVPYVDVFDANQLRHIVATKQHFDANLGIPIAEFELDHLMLDDSKNVVYIFHVFHEFIDEYKGSGSFIFSITRSEIQPCDDDMFDVLNDLEDAVLEKLIHQVQQEMTFGTLKRSQ